MDIRVGLGIDFHRFSPGRRLFLGGIEIPHGKGLEGHSDADVLLHAICDALLGAAALGDIGVHFPPGDPAYAGISSLKLLERVRKLLEEKGFVPLQVDATVIAEAPVIAPYVPAMRERIAEVLGIPKENVSVKGTTPERMGALGREEGIAALAAALIRKHGHRPIR